ncbi:MAG: PAS domain S-box protein [Exilispira sp.]|jgi:PAS domain S-box-containing protein|nr:PAS domain S-box protein [Exilispira sp.]
MDIQIYKNIFDKSPLGYALHKIIIDEKGIPIDYQFLDVNIAFERMTGLKISEIIGKTLKQVLPNIVNDSFDWIKAYGQIALNGTEMEFEQYSETLKKYYKIYVYSPEKYYFIITFIDITSLKQDKNNFKN